MKQEEEEEEEEERKGGGNCILQLPPCPAVGEEEDEKKGKPWLQLPACLVHGCPGDNSRPAPLEEKGDEEEEEEEEGKRVEEEGKVWPTTPSMPCACPPWRLQLPARPARARRYRAPGAPPKVTDHPRYPQHSTAGHLHRCIYSFHNKGYPRTGVCSSALTEIVAKWPKKRRGGSGSSVSSAGGAAGRPRARGFAGAPASQCSSTAITAISYRVFSAAQLDKYLPIYNIKNTEICWFWK